MKLIIDQSEETKHMYSLWSTVEYEDGAIQKDARLESSDDLEEITDGVSKWLFLLKEHNDQST